MTKDQMRVSLVGRAHKDAQELLRQSNAGVSLDYIAFTDGTVCTVNREIVGTLSERIVPIKKARSLKAKLAMPHGYRKDLLTKRKKRS